ncbi:MAG: hypothetical protein R3A44_41175 [Caldilineaceae bacterium]
MDTVTDEQKYYYESSRQNNTQYGNVTQVQAWADGVLQRTTYSYFYPNATNHMVGLQARQLVYDASGACMAESRTHAATGSSINRALNFSQGQTVTIYDVLGRPYTVTAPNGEVTYYSYASRAMSMRAAGRNGDPQKIVKWTQNDGLGNLSLVRNWHWGGSTWVVDAEVRLTHDVTGNLTQVDHVGGGSSTFSYNLVGEKTAMSDVDLGAWSYAYDRQGQLTRQTDARGKSTCLYYGAHTGLLAGKHFRTTTSCPGSVSMYDIRYTYSANHSSSNRSRRQLTQVYYHYSNSYIKDLWYNGYRLLSQEQVRIPNGSGHNSYLSVYTYASDSFRLSTLKYPDKRGIMRGEIDPTEYDNNWMQHELTENGLMEQGIEYDEAHRLANEALGIGPKDDWNLWPTEMIEQYAPYLVGPAWEEPLKER